MVKKISYLIIVITLNVLPAFSQLQKKSFRTFYKMDIHFNPDSGYINCKAEIQNPSDSSFLLTKTIKIHSINADGKSVSFRQKLSGSSPNSFEISIPVIPLKIVIEYSGKIKAEDFPKHISSINMVNKELIELSDYIDWYPRMLNFPLFEYVLDVDLPSKYVTVSNSLLGGKETINNRNITRWKSHNMTSGITLLAAPNLQKATSTLNGVTIEIYYDKIPGTYVDSMKIDLLRSVQLLTELFGSTISNNLIRIVYSPRAAGGYYREPLIIVSEKFALEELTLKYGYARDFRLNTHEIAHYWSAADMNSPDDWINEGLAEFSALLISEKIFGKSFSGILLSEYRGIVHNTQTQTAIVETKGDSWEREINRYYKPTLLLNEIREKYGEAKLKQFLKALNTHFIDSHSANTEIFLDVLEKSIGKEAKDYFDEALHRKIWNPDRVSDNSNVPSDTTLIGTWVGYLTQFGLTARFVLNISLKEGKLVPTLDSPDQNLKDISVSDLMVRNDTISFKVGIASASYKGRLDRNKCRIYGVWTQRGADYPLIISKGNFVK